jgi:hypothetical protein
MIILSSFKPGEPVATLTCKDKKGVVVFEAVIPSGRYLETATLKHRSNTISYAVEDKADILFKPEQKRFSILLDSGTSKQVQITAENKTFKLLKSKKGPGTQFLKVYSFTGRLTTSSTAQVVSLDCRLEYEL